MPEKIAAGVMEGWSNGMMGLRNIINLISTARIFMVLVWKNSAFRPNNPVLHYSNTPTV
jgi:hypothetical protein